MSKFFNSNQVKYFVFYYRRLKWRIPVLMVFSAIVALLDGIGLTLFVPLFTIAETGNTGGEDLGKLAFVVDFFNSMGISLTVGAIILLMLGLFILKGIVNYIDRYFFTRVRVNFMKQTRIQLIEGLCNISYPGFVNIDMGRIQNVITAEIGKAVGAFMSYFAAIQSGIMLAGYLTLAFLANFQFALIIAVAGITSNYIYKFINKKVETASLWQSLIGNGLQSKVLEAVWNYKYLKATDLISTYRKKLVQITNEAEDLSMKMGKLNAVSASIREPITIGIVCAVIFVQVVLMDASVLSMIVSLMFFYRSLTNLMALQNNWQSFLVSSGGIHTVNELYDEFEEKIESRTDDPVENFNNGIEFNHVTFSYAPHLPIVLNDINLTIKKNQTVAFVGESGSGKTTIVNMLAGLLMPVSGQLKIDGIPLTVSRVKGFRHHIGYITQEPVVFNDTVFNNVTFHESVNDETVARFRETLEKTALTSMVENLPEKENSLLGDNGILISGGQKQRISIARELYRDCSLLLMDEATSALDTENELIIQSNINALKGKYTIVIIAHRLSTVKNADVIYLLDKGKIEASGSFDELKNKSPRFRKMVELQDFS
ncbi:MAG: ABC transporter ATP-binding protein/permease [Cytophagaceae bacterium]|jgi:subfamily B ATP-binding cassette protein MsbA|nr:ABC transporter ATP-binding protein/permease [Cytophagaceae bacterium]